MVRVWLIVLLLTLTACRDGWRDHDLRCRTIDFCGTMVTGGEL